MSIVNYPNEIKEINTGEVQLYEYCISQSVEKIKVQLSKNVISFLVEGTKELITNNSSTTVQSNQFLIIKSGNCLMSENISVSNNYRSMLLFFSNASLVAFIERYKIKLNQQQSTNPFFIESYDVFLKNMVSGLVAIKSQSSDFLDVILPLKLEEVLLYMIQKNGTGFLNQFLEDATIEKNNFVTTIKQNVLNNLSVSELAFLCNMSISTFKRNFEKEFKTSPMQWFQNERLLHSDYLIVTKKMRPSDIYETIGFETLSSFTQAYKMKFGITPKQAQLQ